MSLNNKVLPRMRTAGMNGEQTGEVKFQHNQFRQITDYLAAPASR
ncbi:MAG: hypothetical protein SPL42_04310 [Bacteroidales bacterium]|nr:hypothetical protein [Bacteroidales bacterium]MDY6347642.1 hypothetical protein [Bacteroidales bacterium]